MATPYLGTLGSNPGFLHTNSQGSCSWDHSKTKRKGIQEMIPGKEPRNRAQRPMELPFKGDSSGL